MSKKILIVEDDEDVRQTVELILRANGYSVKTDATGKQVFELLERFEPELLLLDINLGELDGREICKKIKKHASFKDLPVIMVSAEPDVYNSILGEGANDIITKPFQEQTLLKRIKRQLSA